MRKDSIAGCAIALLALIWAAYYFRYEPIPLTNEGFGVVMVWDRLTSQLCVVPRPNQPRKYFYCSPDDYERAQKQ
jgi:hypothetical protein